MDKNTLKGIGAVLGGVAGFSQAGADILEGDKADFTAAYSDFVRGKDSLMRGLGLLGLHNQIIKAMEVPDNVKTSKPPEVKNA